MTFTKERLEQLADDEKWVKATHSEVQELARIALAGMEAEPVAESKIYGPYIPKFIGPAVWAAITDELPPELVDKSVWISLSPQPLTTSERAELENYRNAQPDMNYQHLSELYHAQEKRLFKLAQRIKGPAFDKYAHSPSQAIDVLESAIFGEREDEDCRAAMQGKANGTLTNDGTIPATQFKPVADLYGITSPTGSETSFTFDAVEARDFIDGGWSCQEYVELERYQNAVAGNTPVIPDGWVACSEANSALVMLDRIETTDPADDDRIDEVKRIIRELSQPRKNPQCWCRTCRPVKMNDMRFVVCPECGNKRCPHANDHRNACSGSNEPGQEGSAYPAAPQLEAE